MVKYLHDILPLGKRVNMFDPKYPASCPSCQASTEDRAHFWRCPASSRMEWRKNFLTTLRKQLIELKTAPPLQTLLLGTLRAVLDGRDPNTIPIIESLQDLATSQASIGWNNLLKGRLSKEWAVAQQAHLGNRVLANDKSTWTTAVIDHIFQQWWVLWESRNGDRHGRDTATELQAATLQAHRELRQVYDKYQLIVPQTLNWLFDVPLKTRLQWPTNNIRQWLNTWPPTLQHILRPDWAPTPEENHTTALETG